MKKLIAVLLSVALAAGSAGAVPVLAAETAVQESAEGAEKEPMEAQEAEEQTEAGSPVAEDDIRGEGTADITPAEDPADDASVLDAETGEAETGADGDAYSDQENDDPEADLAADTAATSETAAQEEPAEAATGEIAEETSEEAAAEEIPEAGAEEVITEEINVPAETENEALEADITSGDFKYSVNNGSATVVKYNGSATSVTIPSSVNGYTVKSIGQGAFANNFTIQYVTLPSSVTSIGVNYYATGAFQDCISLKSVSFSSSASELYIGFSAFKGCKSLTGLTIPGNCTGIGNEAFVGCSSLETVVFNSGSKGMTIGNNAFKDCGKINTVTLSSNVKKIGDYAFYNNYLLKNLSFSEGLVSIGGGAFYNCDKVESITIPSTVTTIGFSWDGNGAFESCDNLASVTLKSGSASAYIGFSVFRGDTKLKNISIPGNYTQIDQHAFRGCTSLSSVYFYGGSKDLVIGNYAFAGCTGLLSVYTSKNLRTIGSYAFNNDTRLSYLTLCEGLQKIDGGAFAGCTNLNKVEIPSTVTSIGYNWDGTGAFQNCSALSSLTFKQGTLNAYIGFSTFRGCSSLTSVTIPGNYKTIDQHAFRDCTLLKEFTYGSIGSGGATQKIGNYAFAGCSSLEKVITSELLNCIGPYAFSNDSRLATVELHEGLTKIENKAFLNCKSLVYMMIPSTVNKISESYYDAGAFTGCTGLRGVIIEDNPVNVTGGMIGFDTFKDCPALQAVYIPKSFTDIKWSSSWESLKRLTIWGIRGTSAETFANSHNIPFNAGRPSFPLPNIRIGASDVTVLTTKFAYDGKAHQCEVSVVVKGAPLNLNTDYTVSCRNNTNIGTATVVVKGIGIYEGTVTKTFSIVPGASTKVTLTNVASGIKITWNKVSGASYYKVYRGSAYLFTTSQLYGTDTGVKSNNGTKFTYKVIASTTKSDSSGDSTKYRTATGYRLIPVGITSLKNSAAGKMTVTYDINTGSSGYVVRYGLKSDMSDAKVITVKGAYTTSKTFSGLKKGKTYYVQVRTYKLENNVRYYSGYCTTKKIVINK